MNVVNRIDSYIANMKMPWQKTEPPELVSLSNLELYVQSCAYKFEKLWIKQFKSQAICLNWDQNQNNIVVGFDDGHIMVFYISVEYKYHKYVETNCQKLHEKRVMGVILDKDLLYSISEDTQFKIFNIKNNQLLFKNVPSNSSLNSIIKDYNRLFISSSFGEIFIYDISQPQVKLINKLKNLKNGKIKTIKFDHLRNYIFTGSYTGEINLFEIQKQGKEKFANLIANYNGKSVIRAIEWSGNRSEIITGHNDGMINFINAKNGAPIYGLKAHNSAITKLFWLEDKQILISGGKDKSIKFWEIPQDWIDKKIQQENICEQEFKKQNSLIQIIRQNSNKDDVQNDDDLDDLDGWNKY